MFCDSIFHTGLGKRDGFVNKDQKLTLKQIEKKKNLLISLKSDIEKLEKDIKNSKRVNSKINSIRNFKISLRVMQLIAPYAVTVGIIIGGAKLIGFGSPFYRDEFKYKAYVQKQFDNIGNVSYEKEYDYPLYRSESDSENIIKLYSKWTQKENGIYERTIQIYKLDDLKEKDVLKLFDKENLNLEDLLGRATNKIETTNKLTEEQINSGSYLEATMYSKDKNDFIVVKESLKDNTFIAIIEAVLIILLSLIIHFAWRKDCSSFCLEDCIDEIKEKHPDIDIEALKYKLEIKKLNYDRLTR